jgi:hypothetical protein
MRKAKPNQVEVVPGSLRDPSQPRLRELVSVQVNVDRGDSFYTLLTRVPGLGEEIVQEEKSYKVVRVQHEQVGEDGRARFGWHAFIHADLMPPDDEDLVLPSRRRSRKRG